MHADKITLRVANNGNKAMLTNICFKHVNRHIARLRLFSALTAILHLKIDKRALWMGASHLMLNKRACSA